MTTAAGSLRIAQLVETLDAGGAEGLAIGIAGALATRGHASHLVVARSDGPFKSRIPDTVRLHDLDRPRRDGNQAYRIGYFLEACRRLESVLKAQRIEVLQTHLPKANFLGLAMAMRGVCRVYPTVHNNREFDYGDNAGPLRRAMRRTLYRRMVATCPAVIAVSGQVRTSLGGQLGLSPRALERVIVVPNGVAVPEAVTPEARARARARWGVGEEQVLLVGVGRLAFQKNFGDLVAALGSLDGGRRDWRCVIAGDGELRGEIEAAVAAAGLADRVRLAGLVDDMTGLFAAADIFCLPSRFEGLPLVLLEAMGSGLPTVAFGIDGVVDVVADGAQALLAPPGNTAALASALERLVEDGALRARLGAAARELVIARYGFDSVIDRLEAAYRQAPGRSTKACA